LKVAGTPLDARITGSVSVKLLVVVQPLASVTVTP
jgi:hypothetical protein